ncbi:MAG: ABC transporter substrate-binding protein [Anaerolineaceae bacterium]|nr:ABC transporter substrate-binding protein [Anaerolineaceae bacterium]
MSTLPDNNHPYAPPEFSVAPRRIVSLIPSMTETLFDLNLGERVVGRTDYCTRPEERVSAIPSIGGPKNPNISAILSLQPDLVIANHEENRKQDVEALEAAGITVWVTYPRTVDDVFVLLWDVMNALEETSMVPRVRLIEYQYDWVKGLFLDEKDLPRVFVPIWKNPLMTISSDTYMHDLLAVCGGENVFADQEARYPQITLADVEASQPDIVLLPEEPYAFTETDAAEFGRLDIPAAKTQQIHLVDGSLLSWHGTRIAYALEKLPVLLKKVR